MDIDNGSGFAADGVTLADAGEATSPSAETQAQDPLKNLKAEMNRKLGKLEKLISQAIPQPQMQSPVEETDENAPEYVKYVEKKLREDKASETQKLHQQDFQEVLKVFPELQQDSESFDQEFFFKADSYYRAFTKADPTNRDALRDAIELAAAKLGKHESLMKEKLLKDEARRSRIIAEGGAAPREQRREKQIHVNEKGLARLGIKDPKQLESFIKANKDKYGE